jgi:tetratricopeptide (TPR) repeat protein
MHRVEKSFINIFKTATKKTNRRLYSEKRKFLFKKEELDNTYRISEVQKSIYQAANVTSSAKEILPKALEKFNQGDFAEAKVLYDKVLALNPKHTIALQNRGIACIHLNKPVEAILSFDKMLEFFPDPTILILKGEVLLKQGDALNALDCFQSAINIADNVDREVQTQTTLPDASIAIAHLYSAYAWEDVGDIEEAIISYRKALEIDSTKGDYHYYLAKALYLMDESNEAFQEIEKACHLEPTFDTYLLQAKLNMNFNNYQGAIDSLNCISESQIKDSDQNWEYYGMKGLALWNLSLFPESLESINNALDNFSVTPRDEDKGPNKAILLHNRGTVHLSMNLLDLALEDFKSANELDALNPEHLNKYNEVMEMKRKHVGSRE